MVDAKVFVLDANVFIEASRRYYAFDLAPPFWDSLVNYANTKQILSIDRVKIELERGKNQLAKWASSDFAHAFASTKENDIIEYYGRVITWVQGQSQFKDAAKYKFADVPDGWLIAYAGAKGCTVVTHEVLAPDIIKKVPIPNVCEAFDIPYIDTFEMLRRIRFQFI